MQPPKTLAVAAETTKSPGGFGLEAELRREAVKGDAAAITAVSPLKGSFGLDAEVGDDKTPLKVKPPPPAPPLFPPHPKPWRRGCSTHTAAFPGHENTDGATRLCVLVTTAPAETLTRGWQEVNRELETGDTAAAVSAAGAENADGGYRGVADASEFRAATTGFLAARQKQLAAMPQFTEDGVRQVRVPSHRERAELLLRERL